MLQLVNRKTGRQKCVKATLWLCKEKRKTEKDETNQEPKHMNFKYEMYTVEVRLYC